MASKHEVEARFTLRDEMSVQLEAIRKRASALEKEAKGLSLSVGKTQSTFGEFTKGLEQFSPRMGSAVSRVTELTSGLSPLAVGLGVAGAALVAVGGFAVAATKALVDMGDRLTNLSRITGITTDGLQRLEAFGRPIGISLDQLSTASTKLEKSLGEGGKGVIEALRKLGLSMADLARMDADVRLLAVSKALAGLQSPLEQAEAGAALLGRSWADLRLDAESIAAGTDEIKNTIIVSKEALEAGDALGDSWDRLAANSKALAAEAGQPIAEMLTMWVRLLNEAALGWDILFRAMSQSPKIDPNSLAGRFGFDSSNMGITPSAGVSAQELARQKAVNQELKQRMKDEQAAAAAAAAGADEREAKEKEFASLRKKAAEEEFKNIVRLSEAHDRAAGEAWKFWDAAYDKIEKARMDADIESALQGFGPLGFSGGTGLSVGGRFAGQFLSSRAPGAGIGDVTKSADVATASLLNLSDEIANLAHLSDLLGPKMATVFQGLATGVAGLESIQRGFGTLGSTKGFMGTLTGIAGIAGGVGGLVAPIVALLRGLGGPDIGRDVGRDIGVQISEGLAEGIEESGQNAQLFLREIFSEGNLGIDRFAEEVGDLFSFFERGEIGKGTLIGELEETIPILIAHFDELGESGQAQIRRIIAAAESLGIEIGAITDLVQAGFAPDTMEEIAKAFDISNDQVRELAASLGINIQTDLERMAATLGLSVDELNALGAAVQENFGIPIEQLAALLESLGVSAQDLGATLGVIAPDGLADGSTGFMDPDTVGTSIASHLAPGQREIRDELSNVNINLNRLGDKILLGIRDLVAQGA